MPGGSALTVDRDIFSAACTSACTRIRESRVVRDEVTELPTPGIVATGPLTSDALPRRFARGSASSRSRSTTRSRRSCRSSRSITSVAFRASRWGKETMRGAGEEGAYLNCPLTRDEYEAFLDALTAADQSTRARVRQGAVLRGLHACRGDGEARPRVAAFRSDEADRPARSAHGQQPWAVVQLRMEDRAGRMWNLVGFQTRLRYPEQQRVFRMIPGLADAEFLRFGSIHRNSYLNSPAALTPHLSLRDAPTTLFAGQLTGVEGYTESTATGLLAGINLSRMLRGDEPVVPPPTTMLGALYRYLREADPRHFQPMNANFGLVDDLAGDAKVRDKVRKREQFAERALADFAAWRDAYVLLARPPRGPDDVPGPDRAHDSVERELDAARTTAEPPPPAGGRGVPRRISRRSATSRRTRCRAYERDLREFTRCLARQTSGIAAWDAVELGRTDMRGFLAHLTRRGLAKRSMARALVVGAQLLPLHAPRRTGRRESCARGRRRRSLPADTAAYLDRAQAERCSRSRRRARGRGDSPTCATSRSLELFYSSRAALVASCSGINRPTSTSCRSRSRCAARDARSASSPSATMRCARCATTW